MSVKTAAIVTLLGVVCLAPLAGAQSAGLRTPWGDPDLQGIWTGSTLTPLERPARLAGQEFLTEEEAAALERGADESRFVERVPREGDPGTYQPDMVRPRHAPRARPAHRPESSTRRTGASPTRRRCASAAGCRRSTG